MEFDSCFYMERSISKFSNVFFKTCLFSILIPNLALKSMFTDFNQKKCSLHSRKWRLMKMHCKWNPVNNRIFTYIFHINWCRISAISWCLTLGLSHCKALWPLLADASPASSVTLGRLKEEWVGRDGILGASSRVAGSVLGVQTYNQKYIMLFGL